MVLRVGFGVIYASVRFGLMISWWFIVLVVCVIGAGALILAVANMVIVLFGIG